MNLRFVLVALLCAGAQADVSVYERGIPLYYWDARTWQDFTNFGDLLSEKIVTRIVGHRIATTLNSRLLTECGKRKLLGLGSIIHMAEDNDVIWGSGINGKHPDRMDTKIYRFTKLDVRAVRGPLTRQFLLEMGIDCPEVYGDPALLIPRLFPEFKRAENPSRKYIIIPHYSDEHLFINHPHMVTVQEDWDEVIRQILDSRFVISTSLHGIVLAESFGIPARYLKVSNAEPLFKYADYYYGTNRYDFKYATTVKEALQMGREPLPECDLDRLLEAFPYELFPKTERRAAAK
jgi:pyruvyltransferase